MSMRDLILVLIFSAIGVGNSFGQKICSFDHGYQVDAGYKADLVFYMTDREYRAKKEENKGIGFITDKVYRADKKVFLINREYRSDIKLFFTDKEYCAGWKKNNKKPLMY